MAVTDGYKYPEYLTSGLSRNRSLWLLHLMQEACSSFLIIYNVSKKNNIRQLITCALAFGSEPLIVGLRKLNLDQCTPVEYRATLQRFATLQECVQYVRSRGATIVGVEIDPDAKNVESEPFTGSTAFMMGNEGMGMNQLQRETCDSFVMISQFGDGTASLNVAVAASIVLQRFWQWKEAQTQAGLLELAPPDGVAAAAEAAAAAAAPPRADESATTAASAAAAAPSVKHPL